MALASPGYVVRDLIRPATVPPLYKTAPCPRPAQRPVAPWPAPSGLRPRLAHTDVTFHEDLTEGQP